MAPHDHENYSLNSQVWCLFTLGAIGRGAPSVIPELWFTATNASSPPLRSCALRSLGMIHSEPKAVIPFLIKSLQDSDFQLRESAALALAEFGPEAKLAIPDLIKLLDNPIASVRDTAMFALQKIAPDTAINEQSRRARLRWNKKY